MSKNTLKNIRLRKKMTQQQMADFIGCSRRSYISYENEPNKHPEFKIKGLVEIAQKAKGKIFR